MSKQRNPEVDDVLNVVDLPERYFKSTVIGTVRKAGWNEAVEMTFEIDFQGVSLDRIFDLATKPLVVEARPRLKAKGLDWCKKNNTVKIKVKEAFKRDETLSLIDQLGKALELGTIEKQLEGMSLEQKERLFEMFKKQLKS